MLSIDNASIQTNKIYQYSYNNMQKLFFYCSIVFSCVIMQIVVISTWKCEDDETNFDILDMIKCAGYQTESHFVTTKDGYILEMHRIPGYDGSPPVFLQHELFGSSNMWIFSGRNQSLAYHLVDEGYDVWMGNVRGTTYGRAHVNISANNLEFWTYSQHELGVYDLPAEISYIHNFTSQAVFFIGFSFGSPISLIMISQQPDMQSKIRLIIHLAPAVYITNIKHNLARIALSFFNELEMIGNAFELREIPPAPNTIRKIIKYLCTLSKIQLIICRELLMFTFGYDRPQFQLSSVLLLLKTIPDTTSKMVLSHYAQMYESGRFRQYDYGETVNFKIYNSSTPPDYDLNRVKIPNVIIYAENDQYVDPQDVFRLYDELPMKAGLIKINYTNFSHLDFRVAIDAPTLLHNCIVKIMKSYT